MEKTYQIIEPSQLAGLFGNPKHFEFAVAIFYWLIRELNADPEIQSRNIEIEVIRVTYHGSYPALGIYYKDKTHEDVGSLVTASVEKLLREKPVIDLAILIKDSKISWKELTDQLMDSK
jgi:hypothetical protein